VKAVIQKLIAWLLGLTVLMRYLVIAVAFHVVLLLVLASIKIVAIVPAIVASFTDAALPPPTNLQDVPDDPFAAYRDFDYTGPDLGGGGTGQKGPGGTPTAGNTASILAAEARGETPTVTEVISVMSEAATAITRSSANPGGVGLESMGGLGAGTPGMKGPGGPWLGAGRMGPQRSVNLAKHGGSAATERAVLAALRWLKANQKPDGSWDCVGSNEGGTALALLAFFGHGETVDSAEFGACVQKGLEYVVAKVPEYGGVAGNMYGQGLVTFALAEGFAMSGSPALKTPLERAANFIVTSQKKPKDKAIHVGGWRYSAGEPTSDLSVSGWQIMALKSAANAGVVIPPEALDKAMKYVWAMYGKPGFGYEAPGTGASMTAVGILCAQFLGHGDDERVDGALKWVSEQKMEWETLDGFAMYYLYYGSQAMFQGGEQFWPKWNEQMREMLIKNQNSDGHWEPPPRSTEVPNLGKTPVYATALGALTLETYYRFLPMYEVLKKQKKTGPALPKPPGQ